MIENDFMANSVVDSKGSRIIPDVGALGTLPGTRFGQVGVKLGPEVGVGEVGEEIPVSRERLVAELAVGFHVFAETVFRHLLQEGEHELVRHPVVQSHVEPVLLDDFAANGRTLERGHLGHAGEELLLEVDLGEVAQVFGHPLGLDGADGAVVGGGVGAGCEGLVKAGLQMCQSVALACRQANRVVEFVFVVFVGDVVSVDLAACRRQSCKSIVVNWFGCSCQGWFDRKVGQLIDESWLRH